MFPRFLSALLAFFLAAGVFASQPAAVGLAVRAPLLAGSWYPADPAGLKADFARRMGKIDPADPAATPVALVAPHAGYAYSADVAAKTLAALGDVKIRRVFLLGPSHRLGFSGVALPSPNLRAYGALFGPLALDRAALETLRGRPGFEGPATALDTEHSVEMVSLYVAARFPEAKLVPLVVGSLGTDEEVRRVAATLRGLLGPGDLLAVSSDFTHYGPNYRYAPFPVEQAPQRLAELADGAAKPLAAADLAGFTRHVQSTGDTICGSQPLRLLLALLPPDARGRETARDTSGAMTGDFTNSVTYLGLAYQRRGGWERAGKAEGGRETRRALDAGEEKKALAFARRALVRFLSTGAVPAAGDLGVPETGAFRRDGAVFVTLKRDGQLRGCIGHIFPMMPLWQSIRDNAIAAGVRDSRFPPVSRAELDGLELEISLLTPPTPIPGPEGFMIGRHGIVMELAGHRAVFLPQVAPEQGWDREATLAALSRKAGLPPDAWKDPGARFEVFEAQVFGEGQ